ncbi:MAG: AraC family transcriptional regulator [Lachnospiraceae bacterium]|nr:AraC family transcriptional regulator [Lachnospiraceae bacterium]
MQHLASEIDLNNYRNRFCVQKIVRLTYYNEMPDWKQMLHKHDDHCEIIYIESGRGEYIVDQALYSIKAGDIILINSGVAHRQRSDPETPLVSWNLAIQTRKADLLSVNQLLPSDVVPVFTAGTDEHIIRGLFHQLYSEALNKPAYYESSSLLYAELIRITVSRLSVLGKTKLTHRKHVLPEQVKRYIDEHYAEKLTLDDIADLFFVNKYHIVHVMKDAYGVSPIDYMVSRRIGEAQNLLNSTSLSIKEISETVGFTDKNHFTRTFKKRVGLSPLEYRNRYQFV